MVIGVPKEIKNHEYRVGLTPQGTKALVGNNHKVLVEHHAGLGSGFTNEQYLEAGAEIVNHSRKIYELSEIIVKVKEPLPEEYDYLQSNQVIFTYLHLASSRILTEVLLAKRVISIAYESVQKADKSLPLLIPMSEVAGKMAVQQGAKFLEKINGGRGVLLGGVTGIAPAQVLILGAGIVGTQAAKMAAGLGADVILMDINVQRLRTLSEWLPANVKLVISDEQIIRDLLPKIDLVIGAVLVPGGKAPILIKKEMLKLMQKGSVLIDVAVDQGGCIETCKPTTHENPTFELEGIIHYGVPNMPGAVPFSSTMALTTLTLPYLLQLANKGWKKACMENQELALGLNTIDGNIVYPPVAATFNLPCVDWSNIN